MDEKIEKIYEYYEELKKQDCHINDDDFLSTIRHKDMMYGQIMACEKIINILKSN
jgi:hypothetical protein